MSGNARGASRPSEIGPDTPRWSRGRRGRTWVLLGACLIVLAATVRSATVRRRPAAAAAAPPPRASGEAPALRDVARELGLDFVHRNGAQGEYLLSEIMGPGGAFLDYDSDGWLDVFLVQGGNYGVPEPGVTSRLYRNVDGRRFVDVTAESGAGVPGYGMGCAVADIDRDGFVDIYVTRFGEDVLLRNEGDGSFRDVTRAAGLSGEGYTSSAAWLDYDGDGDLDLYVARYTELTPGAQVPCTNYLGQREYCDPSATPPTRDSFYRNLGDGRFEDASLTARVALRTGYGLAVACSDFDADGRVDIYVANDQSPAFLWRNQGDGTFADVALQAGCAYNGQGVAIAGMGIVAEDLDQDDDLDLFVTNIRGFSHLFLQNQGGDFLDVGHRWGQLSWTTPYTGFGSVALDLENDGELELFVANGAVARARDASRYEELYAEPNQVLRREAGRYVLDEAALHQNAAGRAVSRGVARGDFDNDGDVDLLVCRNGAAPQLLRNERGGGHWLAALPMDREGLGYVLNAQVIVEAGGRRWRRECRVHDSYLVSSDPRVHFGLGDLTRVDRLGVRWPDGTLEWYAGVAADQLVSLHRGAGSPERQ